MWERIWDVTKLRKSLCTLTFRSVFSSSPWHFAYVSAHVVSQIVFVSLGYTKGWLLGYWVLVQTLRANTRVAKKILLYIDSVRSIRRHSLVIVWVCGSYSSTLLSESLHESAVVATLLNSASKWKKEGGRGRMCVLSDCPDGIECHVNVNVVVIMSLSGQEETLRKGAKDLEIVKLRR